MIRSSTRLRGSICFAFFRARGPTLTFQSVKCDEGALALW